MKQRQIQVALCVLSDRFDAQNMGQKSVLGRWAVSWQTLN